MILDSNTQKIVGNTALREAAEAQENRLFMETVKDYGIFFLDPNGIVTRWGIGIEKIKFFKAEEVIGKHFSMFYTEEDQEKGRPQHNLKKADREGRYEEVRIRLRKGHIPFWADVVITPLYDESGKLLGFSKIIKDITEQKAWQDGLEQSNRDLKQFATIVSHDLQGPLRKVEKFAQHLKVESLDTMSLEGLNDLERMLQSIHKMQHLTRDLLDLAQVNQRGQSFRPVNLAEMANEVISDLSHNIQDAKGKVEIGEMVTIDGDPGQIHQLFQNLIGNSIKFHQEAIPPIVNISAMPIGENTCRIQVQDNGIGFDQKHAEDIFEPFVQLHGKCAYEGTGIGLTICKRIVERHNGSIRAKSQPCEGAAFIIDIPIKQPH